MAGNTSMLPLSCLLLVFSLSVTFTLCEYGTNGNVNAVIPDYISHCFLAVQLLAASVSTIILLCRADRTDADDDNSVRHRRHQNSERMKLVGIGIFYVAGMAIEVTWFLAEADCVSVWQKYCGEGVAFTHGLTAAYRVTRFVYMTCVVLFCVLYHARRLHKSTTTGSLFCLSLVLSANLSVWFESVVDESKMFEDQKQHAAEDERRTCQFSDLNDTYPTNCVNGTSSLYKAGSSMNPFLSPFVVEFLVLVGECVVGWFFRASEPQTGRHQRQPGQAAQQDNNVGALPACDAASLADRCCCGKCPWLVAYVLAVFASCVFSVLLLLFNGFALYYSENEYGHASAMYRVFYWLLMIACAIVGYAVTREFGRDDDSPTDFEHFVVLCSLGAYLHGVFRNADALARDLREPGKFPGSATVEASLNIIQIFSQTVFYGFARSVRIPENFVVQHVRELPAVGQPEVGELPAAAPQQRPVLDQGCAEAVAENVNLLPAENNDIYGTALDIRVWPPSSCWRMYVFKSVLLYIAVCNVFLWIEDSFVETVNTPSQSDLAFYHTWPTLYTICQPLILVLRFNSGVLFISLFFSA